MSQHIATLNAYPIKDSLGGGYRGVFFIRATKERRASERFETIEEARYWAQVQAHAATASRRSTSRANITPTCGSPNAPHH